MRRLDGVPGNLKPAKLGIAAPLDVIVVNNGLYHSPSQTKNKIMIRSFQSLRYRIWNQTRVAMHLDTWFHTWDVLGECAPGMMWGQAAGPVGSIRQTLFHSLITHIAFMKAKQGVSLYKLIDEAYNAGLLSKNEKQSLQERIDILSSKLYNISRQRNNIVAHRSSNLTFKDVKDRYPVSRDDLEICCKVYYEISQKLCKNVPFLTHQPWQLVPARQHAEIMRDALINNAS